MYVYAMPVDMKKNKLIIHLFTTFSNNVYWLTTANWVLHHSFHYFFYFFSFRKILIHFLIFSWKTKCFLCYFFFFFCLTVCCCYSNISSRIRKCVFCYLPLDSIEWKKRIRNSLAVLWLVAIDFFACFLSLYVGFSSFQLSVRKTTNLF